MALSRRFWSAKRLDGLPWSTVCGTGGCYEARKRTRADQHRAQPDRKLSAVEHRRTCLLGEEFVAWAQEPARGRTSRPRDLHPRLLDDSGFWRCSLE
jgi:hypothetical protein